MATAAYDLVVAGAAVVFAALAVLFWGPGAEALAAGIGGTLAVANWIALRWLVGRLMGVRRPGGRGRVVLAVLFAGKIVVLIAVLWALIHHAALDPIALAFGYSALVVGLFGAAFFRSGEQAEGDADA